MEESFRLLNSGACTEGRRPRVRSSLSKALEFDVVTACKVFDLCEAVRRQPGLPVSAVLAPDELDCLTGMLEGRRILPRSQRGRERPTDARSAVLRLGRRAACIGSKRQPLPGHMKPWQGVVALRQYLQGCCAAIRHRGAAPAA